MKSTPRSSSRASETSSAYATAHGRTLLELAIGALVSDEDVSSVIAGAMTAEQVRTIAEAGESRLSADELAEVIA
jgi:aryl-alcohol dehydrogenase-like predicted oxidoreductase